MTNYALNSAAMLRQFRSTAAMMTVADYDLNKIVADVINHLRDGNNMSDIAAYCAEAMFTRNNGGLSEDGVILARAIKELAENLRTCFIQMKLYDSANMLHYRLQNIVSHTILVERV
jgi:hypothetical protein